jgi:hypothetical protein
MDVLALRKSTGKISGEVCLNGHPQDPRSFRRCTGYVEQVSDRTPQSGRALLELTLVL